MKYLKLVLLLAIYSSLAQAVDNPSSSATPMPPSGALSQTESSRQTELTWPQLELPKSEYTGDESIDLESTRPAQQSGDFTGGVF